MILKATKSSYIYPAQVTTIKQINRFFQT